MADGTDLNAGSGGDTIATDDVTDLGVANGQKVQRIKVGFGADNNYVDVESVSTNPLPVALSATDNGVLDAIAASLVDVETNTDFGAVVGGGTEATALRVTLANDSTGVLTVDNAGTFAVQVDAALPAGTNAIGKLAANSGVDIGDVDVTSVVPGTGATNLGKAIDTAAGSTDTGIAALAVRDDALTTLTPIDGDYTPLRVDSTGALHVNVNSYTDSQVDDAAFSTTSDSVAMIGAVATPTDSAVDADDGGAVAMSLDRRLHVDADVAIDGTSITGGAGAVGASTPRVTLASDDPAVAALQIIDNAVFADDAAFTLTSSSVMVGGAIRDDTLSTLSAIEGDAVPLRVNSQGALHVTGSSGSTQYAEDTAHNSGDTGTMALAVRSDTLAALAGTTGDYTPLQVDALGALYVSEKCRVDSNNSSTSTLLSAATFTGTGTDVTGFRNVNVSVFADQDSATDGLKIQFSSDNSNWDFEEDFTVSASTGETHTVPVMAQYMRVTYTNGGTGQGAFRLQTILVPDDLTGTVANLDTTVGGSNQAVLTRSVLSAFNGTSYGNVQSTAGGNLKMSVQEFSDGVDVGNGTVGSETLRVTLASDSTGKVAVTQSGTWNVNNISGTVSLPTGAATAANQSTANTSLSNIEAGIATEGSALGSGVLLQGDDGTDRKNVSVDATSGNMQVDVSSALPAGTNAIGKLAANSGVDIGDVDVTSISAGSNLIGDVGISGARTSGGTTFFNSNDLDETEEQAKGSAGQIYWIACYNVSASLLYLQVFNNTAAAVTVGSTTPDMVFPIPTQGDTNGAGFVLSVPNGIEMDTGITFAATTTPTGNTGPGANEVLINVGYA